MAVPLIGLYYLYVNRDVILAAPCKPTWAGLLFAVGGVLLYGYGIWPGQNDFVKDFGMVVTLFGIVLMMTGWAVMKITWFPIAFLVCALPWPGLIYSKVAGPLQQLAANVAVYVLQLTGVKAYAGGTKICVFGHNDVLRTLNVAEACAGLRSLMTFISVAAAVAFLSSRALWEKFIIVLSAIPIAIFCNVMRISGQGLLDHYVSQQLSENFAHAFVGTVMLIPAFLLILGVGWVLDQAFVQEAAPEVETPAQVLRRKVQTAPAPLAPPNISAVPPAARPRAVPPAFRSPMRPNLPPQQKPDGRRPA
jgi:exosortase